MSAQKVQESRQADAHADLLAALSSASSQSVSLRTRRAVSQAVRERQADRASGQRSLFLAMLITGGLVLLLIPAIWYGLQEILSGASLADMPVMLAALGMMLFAGVGASLFLLRDERHTAQNIRHHRR